MNEHPYEVAWKKYLKSISKSEFERWKKVPEKYIVGLVPMLKKRNVKRILDLGCGLGRHLIFLAKKDFMVVGSDISSTALGIAEKQAKNEKLKNYLLVKHDITLFPFPENHFDAVISANVIHHNKLRSIKKTVNEIKRVLKKRGLVIVTLLSKNDHKYKKGKRVEKDTYDLSHIKGHAEVGVLHHFFGEIEARRLFSRFKILELKELIKEIKPPSSKGIKKSAHWLIIAEKVE
ncbi:MAG: class I SAM-dependent methyltransferase [Candidatus Aenigmatarchaeota archaeon]